MTSPNTPGADQLAALLAQRYGLEHLYTNGGTDISSLFMATNAPGTVAVEVELFHQPVTEQQAAQHPQVVGALSGISSPAIPPVRDAGITNDAHLYVIREPAGGTPLRAITVSERDTPLVLGPAAEAIDWFNANGWASFVARGIDADRLVVPNTGWNAPTPAVIPLVGPTVGGTQATPEGNRRAFAEVIAAVTGTQVDTELLNRADSCVSYLLESSQPAAPEAVPAPAPADESAPALEPEPETQPVAKATHPETDPELPAQVQATETPAQQTQAVRTVDSKKPAKKRCPWPWVAAGLVALVGLGAAGVYAANQNPTTTEWGTGDQILADAFPDIISEEDGGRGFNDLTCHSKEPEGVEVAKVRCASRTEGISAVAYSSDRARATAIEQIAGDAEPEYFGNDTCTLESYELEGQDPPAYVIAPTGDAKLEFFLFIVNGKDASDTRLALPIC